ncbi:MAG TPA: hypothetical protein VMC79_14835, partial [Rectinemataceae bacterium]|nr:hypothetical protein [Rectinemataceae bacterium]
FLMAEGRIQEEGSAEELFSRPRTAFAARFLGSGPLIPVEALDSDAFGPLARTALGSFRCTLRTGSSRAPEGDLLLHFGSAAAGILTLSSGSEPARENQVRVRVLNAVFAGRFRRVTFEYRSKGSPQGTGILELEFPVDCRCEVGEQLLLEVPPEHCSLLPAVFPREGPRRGDAA